MYLNRPFLGSVILSGGVVLVCSAVVVLDCSAPSVVETAAALVLRLLTILAEPVMLLPAVKLALSNCMDESSSVGMVAL